MAGTSALRLAVVGPTHPYKGGVAAHTTTLARELSEAGHDVVLVSWSRLFPELLYPGEGAVPAGSPDVAPFPRTVRALSWARPDSWVRTGRRLRDVDAILVVHVVPAVVPSHLALLRAAGAGRRDGGRGGADMRGPRSVGVVHNVLPHEPHPGDEPLVRTFLRRVDAVLVHTPAEARAATTLGASHVVVADLPPHLPGGPPVARPEHDGPPRLLALGMVRDYKGIDVLLRALTRVPDVELTVAGEMWGESGRTVKALADHPTLRGRVEVHGGYVPADRLAPLLARHDVLALPYRSATASQNVLLGQKHGLAVLASDVGTFGRQVRDGVDGLLVPPDDEDALSAALHRLAEPGYAARLRSGVRAPDLTGPWATYVGAIEALASVEPAEPDPVPGGVQQDGGPRGVAGVGSRLRAGARSVVPRREPRLDLTGRDIPDDVRPTDVLATDDEAVDARLTARELGLPRVSDGQAAWAALGAIAAVLRVRDDGQRSALIVDESGARSPFARWARAIGFAPVELELSGHQSSVSVLDVETASLDVITRLHPSGCDADDVDEAMHQASWALRGGGLLSITLPVGPPTAEGSVSPADLRGVLARADDLGLVLVGNLEGDLTARLRRASDRAQAPDAAYALIRLTLRRR